ncbi:MAG TPA: hypothetical protein VK561_19280, partial [Bradyrhizobium sp.]|nr:hypothetical protein [Bradyrhizobium sp.]
DTGYWRRWTSDYDYLYVLFTDPDYENPDPARLTPIYAGERFMLYRINPHPIQAGRSRVRSLPAACTRSRPT